MEKLNGGYLYIGIPALYIWPIDRVLIADLREIYSLLGWN